MSSSAGAAKICLSRCMSTAAGCSRRALAGPVRASPFAHIQFAKFGKRRFRDDQILTGRPLCIRIVNADDSVVLRQMKIALDSVGALFPRQFECGDRVLRGVAGCAAMGYDAMKLVATAIRRAGTDDPTLIRNELAATADYLGATSIGRYDVNRHPIKPVVIQKIVNGEIQFHKQVNP